MGRWVLLALLGLLMPLGVFAEQPATTSEPVAGAPVPFCSPRITPQMPLVPEKAIPEEGKYLLGLMNSLISSDVQTIGPMEAGKLHIARLAILFILIEATIKTRTPAQQQWFGTLVEAFRGSIQVGGPRVGI